MFGSKFVVFGCLVSKFVVFGCLVSKFVVFGCLVSKFVVFGCVFTLLVCVCYTSIFFFFFIIIFFYAVLCTLIILCEFKGGSSPLGCNCNMTAYIRLINTVNLEYFVLKSIC